MVNAHLHCGNEHISEHMELFPQPTLLISSMEQANITGDNKWFISLKLQIYFEYSGTETKKYTCNYICASLILLILGCCAHFEF
jgi:hypothetical protein